MHVSSMISVILYNPKISFVTLNQIKNQGSKNHAVWHRQVESVGGSRQDQNRPTYGGLEIYNNFVGKPMCPTPMGTRLRLGLLV